MHLWYDTREGREKEKYPLKGWIFPCFICTSPTARFKTIKNYTSSYFQGNIDIQCCKNCNINVNIHHFKFIYIIKYPDDKLSNR